MVYPNLREDLIIKKKKTLSNTISEPWDELKLNQVRFCWDGFMKS